MIDPWMTKPNHMMKTTAPMPSWPVAEWRSRQRLLAALNTDESKAPRERLTPPKTNEAPKDYAPKEPDAPGTLDESFGLKR